MLIVKPIGRGNWKKTSMHIEGGHTLPLMFIVGARFRLGGVLFRICEVIA
jgi:hypothetical protein